MPDEPQPPAPAPRKHAVACVGGPMHMRTVNVQEDASTPGMPMSHLNVPSYPAPDPANLDQDGRVGGSMLDVWRDIEIYSLGPARLGTGDGPMVRVYRHSGKERESWGWHNEIRDLDDTTGRPGVLGDAIDHCRQGHGGVGWREFRNRWAIVLPQFTAPTVTVYRTLPVIHAVGIVTPLLVIRPAFPTWIDERMF